MATYNTEQRRTGIRSWGRGRWSLIAIIVLAIAAVAIVLLTYSGGSYSGTGFGNGIAYTGTAPSGGRVQGVSVYHCLSHGIYLGFNSSVAAACGLTCD